MAFLASGIPDLDVVLGGGIPEGDIVLVIGPPGSGKTTLAFQHAFHAAAAGRSVVCVSALSEPASRLVAHLRTFSFWNPGAIGKTIHIESIDPLIRGDLEVVVDALVRSVSGHGAKLLVLDGLMTIRDLHPSPAALRTFLADLGAALAPLGCTLLLTSSDVSDFRTRTPPELTICDAVLELTQRDSPPPTIRTVRAWKVRGAPNLLGAHSISLDGDGVRVFPRLEARSFPPPPPRDPRRISIGSTEVDAMMQGGLPRGGATIVAGAPGTGKTLLGLQYLMAGAERGERGLFVGFRETPELLVGKARAFGMDLETAIRRDVVHVQRRVPIELRIDEVLTEMWKQIEERGTKLLVIDDAIELELAISEPARRRAVMAALTEMIRAYGVTALLARDMSQIVGPELDFADSPLEVLAENVVLLRYAEYEGELVRIVSVVKMRESAHDRSIRQYELGDRGLRVLAPIDTAEGLLTGIARRRSEQRVERAAPTSEEGAT